MRVIKIPFPDVSFYEKTRMIGETSKVIVIGKGSASLYFRNPAGFKAKDFFVIEGFESEDAEICQVRSVDKSSHIIELGDQTYQEHAVGVIIFRTPYNKVRVYKGTSNIVSQHTVLDTIDLRPDTAYTVYDDAAGTSADYYSYKYVNTANAAPTQQNPDAGLVFGTQTLYTESDYNAVLTVDNLKNWFMFGLDLTDDDGYPFPNSMFEFAIRAAVNSLEKTLNIRIKPTQIIGERQDYYRTEYTDFAFIQLNEYPIYDVSKVALRYPTAGSDITFPVEWYQINKAHGQIHLIPTSGSLSSILIGRGGDYLTFVWKGWDYMPNLWVIDYKAGFPPLDIGSSLNPYIAPQAAMNPSTPGVPDDIVGIIGRMACFYPLNIAGDLVGGIAIASKSIGIDGLSQSINTTSSPENAGYCLVGDTDIFTLFGQKSIKSLVGSQPFVYSLLNGRWVVTKASEVWLTKKNAEIWKIKVGNDELLPTKNHPIKMFDGSYRDVKNLKLGDIVITSKGLNEIREITPRFSKADVFDMRVPATSNFIGNQIVVHNSARLRQYEKELKIEVPRLVAFYKGLRMAVC